MNIQEFKQRIENNTLVPGSYILQCAKGSEFVFLQYLDKYAKDHNIQPQYVESLDEVPQAGLFSDEVEELYFCYEKSFTELPKGLQNVWVRCEKAGKKIPEELIIEIPKLESWQIKDYAYTTCPGVDKEALDKLVADYPDMYALNSELQKIAIFPEEEQQTAFLSFRDQLYTEKSSYNIFDISNAVLQRDRATAAAFLKEIQNIDVEPYGLLKLLIDNFRRIISIQTSPTVTPETLGISSKQFWAIKKHSINFYSIEELTDIYNFLTSIDLKIKSGELDTKILNDYMITYILLRGR